jgi:hypothetical protein
MRKRIQLTDTEAKKIRAGKGVVKKKRKPEISAPKSLPSLPMDSRKHSRVTDTRHVDVPDIKITLEDTVDRVWHEIYSGLGNESRIRLATNEEAYVILLGMLLGDRDDNPRHGMRFREHDFGKRPLCQEHK